MNTPKLHILSSDPEMEEEFLRCVKHRSLEQKFLYLNGGAALYYEMIQRAASHQRAAMATAESVATLRKHLVPGEKVAFVSLGCGNAHKEVGILGEAGEDMTFFGVDSSRTMLDLAIESVSRLPTESHLLLADMTSSVFRSEILRLTRDFDRRIFAFFGATIGNVSQTEIVDTLYNMLLPGDLIWVDAHVRASLSKADSFLIFERYEERLHDPKVEAYCLHALEHVGVAASSGRLTLTMEEEGSIGALRLIYNFEFMKPTKLLHQREIIHCLPPERIELLTMRIYHAETMVNFFRAHDFEFLEQQSEENFGRFLFRRR